jgi:hypothetical protein
MLILMSNSGDHYLLKCGLTVDEIRVLLHRNPAWLLGLA